MVLTILGGIAGATNGKPKIYNSYNLGEIVGTKTAGGIIGNVYAAIEIKNCYNIGNVSTDGTGKVGGIMGSSLWLNPEIKIENTVFLNTTATLGIGNNPNGTAIPKDSNYIKSIEFVNLLNNYITNNENTENWKKWTNKNKEYPEFE